MAKRKNSAALFEVIHADKRYNNSRSRGWALPALPSPAAWFKRRSSGSASADSTPTVDYASAHTGPGLLTRLTNRLTSIPRVKMALDPDYQTVSFKLSYTTALVAAFAIFAVVALAFVVGKQMTRHVVPALADMTTDELRSGPAQPSVLDVGSDAAPLAMATDPVKAGSAPKPTPAAAPTNKPATVRPSWSEPKPPTTSIDLNQKRTVNMHYVLVQSYPAAEKQMAEEACQALNKYGVLCTVEFNTYYSPNWYAVVGVAGFDRIRNSPEYDAYVDRIVAIGEKFGEKSKFKKFEPKPFKWREPKAQ